MSAEWMKAAANAVADATPHLVAAPPIVEGRRIHVDGDMIAYWAGGNEDTPVAASRGIAASKIEAMRMQAGAENVVLHLTATSSSKADRYMVATAKPYQGQRKSGRKPQNWEYLRNWMESYVGPAFKVKLWGTREADDGIAWMMHHYKGEHVLATKDKDMRMLPGWHMDWDNMSMLHVPVGTFDLVHDGKQYGHKWFWLQCLQGDTADNVPGLPRYHLGDGKLKQIGEKTAVSVLDGVDNNDDAYRVVRELYSSYYDIHWADAFVEQALLLWLRTDKEASPYNLLTLINDPPLRRAIDSVVTRIKEKYAEAHRITGVSPARQDA